MKILKGPTDEETDELLQKLTAVEKVCLCLSHPIPTEYIRSIIDRGIMDDLDGEDIFLLCKQYSLGDKYFQLAIDKGLFNHQSLFYNRLQSAVESNSIQYVIRELTPCIDDIRFQDMVNHLLISASQYGSLDVIKYLISIGADVSFVNHKNETPLLNAALNGKMEVVRFLVENGADVMVVNENGATVLNYSFSNYEVMKYFLELSVHPDHGNPILQSAMYNDKEVLNLLLSYGADINLQDEACDSALLNAFIVNNVSLFKYLISRGADVNLRYQDNNTMLMYAAKYGNLEIIKILFEHGADPNLINNRRLKAMDIALEHMHMNAVNLIFSLMENSDEEIPLLTPMEEIECFNETVERMIGPNRSKERNHYLRDASRSW